VDLAIPAGPLAHLPCEYVQAEWQNNLGVTINWRALDWEQLEALRGEPLHLEWMGWEASIPDPDEMLSALPGLAGWRNADFNRLIAQARRATDQSQRLKLYVQADKVLVEDSAIIPLIYSRRHLLFKPWLRRLSQSVASRSWWWKEVIIEPH
jgi:ABC-type oligopeptide transport system substrate-binding subunit